MRRWLQRLRCLLGHDWVYDPHTYESKRVFDLHWRTCGRCGEDHFKRYFSAWQRGDKREYLRLHPKEDVGRQERERLVRSLLED